MKEWLDKHFVLEKINDQFCIIPTIGFTWNHPYSKLNLNFMWLCWGFAIRLIPTLGRGDKQ